MVNDKIGVGIIAYNRPHYLQWTIHSLESQDNAGQVDYHLFLDGPRTNEDKSLVAQSKKLFEISNLPNKTTHQRNTNVSIARNQLEAKDYLTKHYDYFIICEDDIILSPDSIRVMRVISDYLNDPKIFSVTMSFLRHCQKIQIPKYLNTCYLHDRSHWWFELYRSSQWLKIRPYFMEYYQVIKDMEYKNRNHTKIREFFRSNDFLERRTSQDSGMDYALLRSEMKRITPTVNRGMYIGITGTHFNQILAQKYHFGEQTPYTFNTDPEVNKFDLIDKSKIV